MNKIRENIGVIIYCAYCREWNDHTDHLPRWYLNLMYKLTGFHLFCENAADIRKIPKHLIDVRPFSEPSSVIQYCPYIYEK